MSGYERVLFHGWDVTDNGCWEYAGDMRRGYGRISIRGVAFVVTRVVYEHHHGTISPGYVVRHKCDNPSCVNPDHLEVGTAKENALDMVERGRAAPKRGEQNTQAKLTEQSVRRIRELKATGSTERELAQQFGVSIPCISSIVCRQRWKHVA